MKLRGIEFGNVFGASGALNFFGEGWRHHKYYRQIVPRFSFNGMTFIAKTITLEPRTGNMPLDENLQPKEFFPDCIYTDFMNGIALNAVGLSNIGAKATFNIGKWQRAEKPFIISFMPMCGREADRLEEVKSFVKLFADHLPDFTARVALEINISCPNVKHDLEKLAHEAIMILKASTCLGIPLIIKLNAMTYVLVAKRIAESGHCDALDISNTIPFGQMPNKIDWFRYFGKFGKDPENPTIPLSPLKKYGGGGLSGKPLLPIVTRWIKDARRAGIDIPIIGGGGILCKKDIDEMELAGADAISLGTVTMLRPWKVQGLINYGNRSK